MVEITGKKRRKAFTLIEILIVVTVMALLAGIVISTQKNSARKGRETVLRHNLMQLRMTLDQYNNDKGHYPNSIDVLVEEGYLREIPMDPFTQSRESWQVIYEQDVSDEDSSYEIGIFDVKSGSEEQAIDGTWYYEW